MDPGATHFLLFSQIRLQRILYISDWVTGRIVRCQNFTLAELPSSQSEIDVSKSRKTQEKGLEKKTTVWHKFPTITPAGSSIPRTDHDSDPNSCSACSDIYRILFTFVTFFTHIRVNFRNLWSPHCTLSPSTSALINCSRLRIWEFCPLSTSLNQNFHMQTLRSSNLRIVVHLVEFLTGGWISGHIYVGNTH